MKRIFALSILMLSVTCLQAQKADKIETFDNGNVKAEYYVSADQDVQAKFYYQSGQLMEEGTFASDLRDGKWTSYTRSGKINAIGFYVEGNKTGVWQFWNFQGELSHEVDYSGDEPKMMVYNQK